MLSYELSLQTCDIHRRTVQGTKDQQKLTMEGKIWKWALGQVDKRIRSYVFRNGMREKCILDPRG
jgi:hypothetical protein